MNKKLKKIITTTFLATMCIVMIGCNSKSNSNSATTSLNKEAVAGYPVEITTYNYSGDEVKTTYEKAPEKVLAVYQGSIETMLELGLEDRLVAAAGLDNELDDIDESIDKFLKDKIEENNSIEIEKKDVSVEIDEANNLQIDNTYKINDLQTDNTEKDDDSSNNNVVDFTPSNDNI